MKEIIISSIFKEVGCRISYDLLAITKNGELYEIQKAKAANGKISEAIAIEDDISANTAKSEFLRNYLRSGNLQAKTKKKILSYIKKLEEDMVEVLEYNENSNYIKESRSSKNVVQGKIEEILIENSVKFTNKEKDTGYVRDVEKFVYNTTAHDIQKMASLIIESRINNVSPYTLLNKYELGAGTIYTWYKDINELRILYTFYYNLEYNEIKSILSNYDKKDIIAFEAKLIKDIQNDNRLDENIKKVYIDLVKKNKYEKEKSDISDVDRYMKKIILDKILNGSSGLSEEFIYSKKQEIINLIMNNETMLDIIIDNIELEI